VPHFDLGRHRGALLAAAAVAGVAVALRFTVFAPEPVPVEVAAVDRGRVEQTVSNSRAGTVKARRRAKLSPQEGGRVVALPKRKGDRVRAGDVLLELDPSVPRARLDLALRERDSAAAERTRACVASERSQRELERNRRLADQGIV
jgi:HlyD family secretion protein